MQFYIFQGSWAAINPKTDSSQVITTHWLSHVRQKTQRKSLVAEIVLDTGKYRFNHNDSETSKSDTFQRQFFLWCTDNDTQKSFRNRKLSMIL